MPERLKQNVAAFLHPSDRRLKHTRPEDWSHDVWTVVGKILRDHRVSQRRTSLLLVNRAGLCVVSELILIHEFDSFGLVFSPPLCARAGTFSGRIHSGKRVMTDAEKRWQSWFRSVDESTLRGYARVNLPIFSPLLP
jgi:hypothetical protein